MSVRMLWVGAGASPSLLEPRSLPGSGLVIFHLQLLSQNSDWRKTAGRREGAGRGLWPGRTSLALDLASRRLPLGTFWRRLAELCLPDTSPLLPWMIPCVVLSWKGSRVSLRREKKISLPTMCCEQTLVSNPHACRNQLLPGWQAGQQWPGALHQQSLYSRESDFPTR